jgi:hypothetical protein
MSVVALPWVVLETTGSPGRMSVVLAAEAAPLALLALVSGRSLRGSARGTLLAGDLLWAPATAAIPLLRYAGALSFGALLALAFATGIPWAAHHGARSAIVPELLGEATARWRRPTRSSRPRAA